MSNIDDIETKNNKVIFGYKLVGLPCGENSPVKPSDVINNLSYTNVWNRIGDDEGQFEDGVIEHSFTTPKTPFERAIKAMLS